MRVLIHRIRNHPHIQQRPGLKQFIKFSLVGVSNTIIDFSVFFLMTEVAGVHYLPANVVSFTVAVTWSFLVNRRWTFQNTGARRHVQYVKFLSVSGVGLGLTSVLLFVFVDLFHLHKLIAKTLAVLLVLFWNFTVNRKWTFR